ncbi:universal stress protein [Flagellimonas sp.]|uniref:universal stress protein n=1 Tax=Flagellimonas sp. TaxID=2058762 RepID=UPI003B5C8A46
MKHILLPTDFSKNALKACEYAIALFKKEASTFYVLHADPSATSTGRGASLNKELAKTVAHLKNISTGSEHHFETKLLLKDLFAGVERFIIEKDIDFIVMGTKGSSALKELFMGSKAVKMLESIRICPILMVPDTYQHVPIERFMIATNFDHYYERVELNPVIRLAKNSGVEIQVVHVIDGAPLSDYQEKLKALLKKKMKGINFSFEEVSQTESLANTITELVAERNVHLLAMIYHRYGFFKELFATGVIKKLAFNTSVPFLVLPEVE